MAILSLARSPLARWPLAARIAFRNAVLADPEPFLVRGEVDAGAVLIEAQVFLACWSTGTPWPRLPLALPAPAPTVEAPREIRQLAERAAVVGIDLALAMAGYARGG